jgi:hypothetical protein
MKKTTTTELLTTAARSNFYWKNRQRGFARQGTNRSWGKARLAQNGSRAHHHHRCPSWLCAGRRLSRANQPRGSAWLLDWGCSTCGPLPFASASELGTCPELAPAATAALPGLPRLLHCHHCLRLLLRLHRRL